MIDLQKKIIAQLQDGPASKMRLRMALMCSSDDLEAAMDKLESVGLVESELVGSNYLYSNVRHVLAAEKKEVAAVAKTIKEQILEVFGGDLNKALKAADIADLLPESSNSGVKTTIYRMAGDGELFKKGNFFFLPGGVAANKADAPFVAVDQPEIEVTRKNKHEPVSADEGHRIVTGVIHPSALARKEVDASINMAGIVSITNGMSSIQLTKAEFQRVAEFVGGVGA